MQTNEHVKFLAYWVANSIFILILSTILPGNIVLGANKISPPLAGVVAGFLLAALLYAIPKVVDKLGLKIKDKRAWPALFFGGNVVLIWIIKRFSEIFGLGISNIFYVLIAAFVITAVEWAVGQASDKWFSSK